MPTPETTDTTARVILVKPGDVLIFGNVGHITPAQAAEMTARLEPLKDRLGLAQIMFFAGDIDLAAIPGEP